MRVHFRTENFGVVRNCHVEYRLIPTLYFSNEVHFQEFCGNEVHFQICVLLVVNDGLNAE